MVDYYWLKSFTEILQLFISVLFLIYLKVKYPIRTTALRWLSIFLFFKCLEDLYGVLNYTVWIEELLTREVLNYYRSTMATLELGMLAGFFLFASAMARQGVPFKKSSWLYFLPALLIMPVNFILVYFFNSGLTEVFLLVRLLFAGVMIHLWVAKKVTRSLNVLVIAMFIWNMLWFSEVLLFETGVINEPASWIVFVLAELAMTIGLTYFLVQVIARPKILKLEAPSEVLPNSLYDLTKARLTEAMEVQHLYKEQDLTLKKLADCIEIPPTDLTRYLNRVLQKNFNQYITDFRIEDSKRLLLDSKNKDLTIEQVMYESGFNSKSVFNTAFKNNTGTTPSQFRKTIRPGG